MIMISLWQILYLNVIFFQVCVLVGGGGGLVVVNLVLAGILPNVNFPPLLESRRKLNLRGMCLKFVNLNICRTDSWGNSQGWELFSLEWLKNAEQIIAKLFYRSFVLACNWQKSHYQSKKEKKTYNKPCLWKITNNERKKTIIQFYY